MTKLSWRYVTGDQPSLLVLKQKEIMTIRKNNLSVESLVGFVCVSFLITPELTSNDSVTMDLDVVIAEISELALIGVSQLCVHNVICC